ncbi:MAG: hypothetical protein WAN35_19760 [Terracidiphilus sp.]
MLTAVNAVPPPPPVELIVIVLPTVLTVTFDPAATVTAVVIPLTLGTPPPPPLPHGLPASAICPDVPVKLTQSPFVDVVGPVVTPAPAPAKAVLLVMVVGDPAMPTCPGVIPDRPLLLDVPHVPSLLRYPLHDPLAQSATTSENVGARHPLPVEAASPADG